MDELVGRGGNRTKSIVGFDPAAFKEERVESGLSIAQIARIAGVSWHAIERWENGSRTPSSKLYRRVVDVLDLADRERMRP